LGFLLWIAAKGCDGIFRTATGRGSFDRRPAAVPAPSASSAMPALSRHHALRERLLALGGWIFRDRRAQRTNSASCPRVGSRRTTAWISRSRLLARHFERRQIARLRRARHAPQPDEVCVIEPRYAVDGPCGCRETSCHDDGWGSPCASQVSEPATFSAPLLSRNHARL